MSIINAYNKNCQPAMQQMKENQYDLVIVDPPYGVNISKYKTFGKRRKTYSVTNYKTSSWDSKIPSKEYFNKLFRISKNQIIFGGNYFIEYLKNTRCVLFWDKQYIPEGFSMADCEMMWTSFDSPSKRIRVNIEHNNISNNKEKAKLKAKIHPTQKPIQLYKWLLQKYAKTGDKILDTHGGSMSIVIACIELGFDIDIYEIDKDYFRDAKKRIINYVSQINLFNEKPIINFYD